jgi:hypothetical protein
MYLPLTILPLAALLSSSYFWLVLSILGLGGYLFGYPYYLAYRRQVAENQLKQYFAKLADPILVTAIHPFDRTVNERAEWYRDAIERSGNKWKPPVICVPYGAPIGPNSTIGLTWQKYLFLAYEHYRLECAKWAQTAEGKDSQLASAWVYDQRGQLAGFDWLNSPAAAR